MNRITVDLDTRQVVEDRSTNLIEGRERRREFKGGPRNTMTTFTYRAKRDVRPHCWSCLSCKREGWLKTPNVCESCNDVGTVRPIKRNDICVVHREQDGKAYAWGDVSGSVLDPKLTLKAREEEMEQFRKHGVYEKVK